MELYHYFKSTVEKSNDLLCKNILQKIDDPTYTEFSHFFIDALEKASGSRSHLIPKKITDKNGVTRTVWVKPTEEEKKKQKKKGFDEEHFKKPKKEFMEFIYNKFKDKFKAEGISKKYMLKQLIGGNINAETVGDTLLVNIGHYRIAFNKNEMETGKTSSIKKKEPTKKEPEKNIKEIEKEIKDKFIVFHPNSQHNNINISELVKHIIATTTSENIQKHYSEKRLKEHIEDKYNKISIKFLGNDQFILRKQEAEMPFKIDKNDKMNTELKKTLYNQKSFSEGPLISPVTIKELFANDLIDYTDSDSLHGYDKLYFSTEKLQDLAREFKVKLIQNWNNTYKIQVELPDKKNKENTVFVDIHLKSKIPMYMQGNFSQIMREYHVKGIDLIQKPPELLPPKNIHDYTSKVKHDILFKEVPKPPEITTIGDISKINKNTFSIFTQIGIQEKLVLPMNKEKEKFIQQKFEKYREKIDTYTNLLDEKYKIREKIKTQPMGMQTVEDAKNLTELEQKLAVARQLCRDYKYELLTENTLKPKKSVTKARITNVITKFLSKNHHSLLKKYQKEATEIPAHPVIVKNDTFIARYGVRNKTHDEVREIFGKDITSYHVDFPVRMELNGSHHIIDGGSDYFSSYSHEIGHALNRVLYKKNLVEKLPKPSNEWEYCNYENHSKTKRYRNVVEFSIGVLGMSMLHSGDNNVIEVKHSKTGEIKRFRVTLSEIFEKCKELTDGRFMRSHERVGSDPGVGTEFFAMGLQRLDDITDPKLAPLRNELMKMNVEQFYEFKVGVDPAMLNARVRSLFTAIETYHTYGREYYEYFSGIVSNQIPLFEEVKEDVKEKSIRKGFLFWSKKR